MKAKELSKKLLLNKETVTNLDESQMKDVKGGWFHMPATYFPIDSYC
jgi:natural product precursor